MDGLEAARRLRGMGLDSARLPIMAITADGFASDREAGLAAGMDGFISKPFEPRDIEREIDRLTGAKVFRQMRRIRRLPSTISKALKV